MEQTSDLQIYRDLISWINIVDETESINNTANLRSETFSTLISICPFVPGDVNF